MIKKEYIDELTKMRQEMLRRRLQKESGAAVTNQTDFNKTYTDYIITDIVQKNESGLERQLKIRMKIEDGDIDFQWFSIN